MKRCVRSPASYGPNGSACCGGARQASASGAVRGTKARRCPMRRWSDAGGRRDESPRRPVSRGALAQARSAAAPPSVVFRAKSSCHPSRILVVRDAASKVKGFSPPLGEGDPCRRPQHHSASVGGMVDKITGKFIASVKQFTPQGRSQQTTARCGARRCAGLPQQDSLIWTATAAWARPNSSDYLQRRGRGRLDATSKRKVRGSTRCRVGFWAPSTI
jgi:hypothetical protein